MIKTKKILLLSTLSIFLTYFLLWFSKYTFPYKGFFPYKEVALEYSKTFLSKAANFDGVHYLKIAKDGYAQFEQAFFPLYPLLIRLFSNVFGDNFLYAGIFVSNFCFIFGVLFFYLVLKNAFDKKTALWSILFLLAFPTSFYFNMVYTEALFLFLFSAGLYFLQKNETILAFVSFYLLGMTRVIGFLASILVFSFKKIFVALAPVFGLLTYMFYLFKTTGDPLFFFHSQPAFGANRSDSIVILPQVYFRYLKIFLNTPLNIAFFTALLEFLNFNLVFFVLLYYFWQFWKKKRIFQFSFEENLLWFSLFSLILPTLTGTLSSIPRYSLLCLSFFIFLGKKLKQKWIKIVLLSIFLLLKVILTLLFAQGYFIS